MRARRALVWVAGWVGLALIAIYLVFHFYGKVHGLEFLTCYLIEWSLSVDNLFVFLMIFKAFGVDGRRQRRVLNWGIACAVVFRLLFILLGVALVNLFEPIMYLFGAILVYSAIQMAFGKDESVDVTENVIVKYVRRHVPMTHNFEGTAFFVRKGAGFIATPMLLVLVAVEVSDVVFAVDSVPAAFAITRNPYIIFAANILAILGLRSLYFMLASAEERFWMLKYGVALVLLFIGLKMLVAHWFKVSGEVSLIVVVGTLFLALLLSYLIPKPGDAGSSESK